MLDLTGGADIGVFTLQNNRGSRAVVSNFGCALMALHIADRQGRTTDVVLGYDTPAEYSQDPYFIGVVVGRVAGRIAGSTLELAGAQYPLTRPASGHHLHGGERGLGKRAWQVMAEESDRIRFQYESPEGEEGYPGRVVFCVDYELTDNNEFIVCYTAESDRETVVSPTQHSYFNLGGHASGVVLDHELTVDAERFVPVDEALVPLRDGVPVDGTAMDFRESRNLRRQLAHAGSQLDLAGGFDHSFVLGERKDWRDRPAAVVREPRSGREMAVYTDRPALHFFSGNTGSDVIRGKEEVLYGPRHGFCLETQHIPTPQFDSAAASVQVAPGAGFVSETRFAFRGF